MIIQVVKNSVDFSEDQFISKEKIVFQQDGYSTHYKKDDSLDKSYKSLVRESEIIFRMASRSLDLVPNDSPPPLLWMHLNTIIYKTLPNFIEELKQKNYERL